MTSVNVDHVENLIGQSQQTFPAKPAQKNHNVTKRRQTLSVEVEMGHAIENNFLPDTPMYRILLHLKQIYGKKLRRLQCFKQEFREIALSNSDFTNSSAAWYFK